MKKKIAIVFNRMVVGGAEKVLINLLKEIDTTKYDVTLFTYNDKGAYFADIPPSIRIQFTKHPEGKQILFNDIKKLRLLRVLKGLYCRVMIRLCRDEYKKFSYSILAYPKFKEKYDCAIAYKMNFEDTATVIWQINAKKKCAVMHSDIERTCKQIDRFIILLLLYSLDRIFCVSEASQKKLNLAYPMYRYKTLVMHNVMNREEIICNSQEDIQQRYERNAILTVGRLSKEKSQQMVPKVARLLLDAGYDIHWYLVGDGPMREEIEQEIKKHDVTGRVVLLGTQLNPYPYIKNCDIYVQPSFSEGYCTTTVEAKILHKPIVTTDAPGMREQFVSGENGLIVDAMTPEALFEGIKTLLDHPELCRKFTDNLKLESFNNAAELQKLYDFIEN